MCEQGPLPSLAAQGLGAAINREILTVKKEEHVSGPPRVTRVIHLMIQSEVA